MRRSSRDYELREIRADANEARLMHGWIFVWSACVRVAVGGWAVAY